MMRYDVQGPFETDVRLERAIFYSHAQQDGIVGKEVMTGSDLKLLRVAMGHAVIQSP